MLQATRLLLALAAGLLTVQAGKAADGKRPEALARACAPHGPGFTYVASTGTCMRIGGRVRAEGEAGAQRSRRHDRLGLGASGQLDIDVRTQTDYGPVRTYVRVKGGR